MTRSILHFCLSLVINGIFWILIMFNKSYLHSGEVWAWIEVGWFFLMPLYSIWRLSGDNTRKPYLLGLVSSLLVVLLLKYVF